MKNKSLLVFAVVAYGLLTGCSMMTKSGVTEYSLKPVKGESGEYVCCEATVYNSKDYESLKFTLKKQSDGTVEVMLDESGVSSSDPASIQSQNNSKLLDAIGQIIPKVVN